VLVIIPFFIQSRTAAIAIILAVIALRAFGLNLADPSITSLAADLVPPYMRGRYFSLRNFLMGTATLVITPLAGWMISRSAAVTGSPLSGFQFSFLLAFGAGMMATRAYSRIKEPPFRPTSDSVSNVSPPSQSLRQILRGSRALTAFVISAFVWNMSVQIAAPYFNVYVVTQMGGTAANVGIVGAASALAALFGQIFFGRLTDKKSYVWIYLAAGFSITLLPMGWTFYNAIWQVGINNLAGGFLWAGFTLANFNLLLLLTPDAQRPRAAALYQTAVFTSAVIGPLIGGYLADNVSFPLIFMVSGLGRLLAMVLFVLLGARAARIQERTAFGG
jgi:MFS family permease